MCEKVQVAFSDVYDLYDLEVVICLMFEMVRVPFDYLDDLNNLYDLYDLGRDLSYVWHGESALQWYMLSKWSRSWSAWRARQRECLSMI